MKVRSCVKKFLWDVVGLCVLDVVVVIVGVFFGGIVNVVMVIFCDFFPNDVDLFVFGKQQQ
jgi:hypothetical protein